MLQYTAVSNNIQFSGSFIRRMNYTLVTKSEGKFSATNQVLGECVISIGNSMFWCVIWDKSHE